MIPLIDKVHNSIFTMVMPINPTKNTSMFGLNVTISKDRYADEDITKLKTILLARE